MKNILILILAVISIQSCRTSVQKLEENNSSKDFLFEDLNGKTKNIYKGKLDNLGALKLKKYLKSNHDIDLDEIKYLTISYLKPRNDCWYENHKFLNSKKSNKLFNKIRTELNSEILFLHNNNTIKDGESKLDKNQFIYNFFPKGKEEGFCDYTVTLSYSGNYFIKVSHYHSDVANAFKNELEILDLKSK